MKVIMAGIFGFVTGGVISFATGYTIWSWEYFACIMPIIIVGVIYAKCK